MNPRLIVVDDRVETYEKSGRWRTLSREVCIIWRGLVICAPAGFRFNGASMPFVLWWWVSPWTPWVTLAACIHDWLYRNRMFTRSECDRIFLALLRQSARQTRWRWLRYRRLVQSRIMYQAVRRFGERYWDE